MRARAAIVGVLAVLMMATATPAHAQIIEEKTCKTFRSYNGNAKVKLCASAFQDTIQDRTWARFYGAAVSGYQEPSNVDVILRQWSSNGAGWCNGRAPGCIGGGNAHAGFGGMPATMQTEFLGPTEHYCTIHAEVDAVISWPAGGNSTPDFNSVDMGVVSAGCL